MERRLLEQYEQELTHLREMGRDFARQFPKVAGRLDLDADRLGCGDPYVERLLEGFAFMAARVQLKIDAEFPQFTQHLLQSVYPNYLAPTPSMAIVQIEPQLDKDSLATGPLVPRGSSLHSAALDELPPCQFTTAHDVQLWPLELNDAQYFTSDVATSFKLPNVDFRAGIHLRLRSTAGVPINELPIDSLDLFIRGSERWPMRIYEQLLSSPASVVVQSADGNVSECLAGKNVRRLGFDKQHAMLPNCPASFHGYRLLQEYFALPERFLFVQVFGLSDIIQQCEGDQLDLFLLSNYRDDSLANRVTRDSFGLFCTPAVNLFSKQLERAHVDGTRSEYQVIPDRTRPIDFEVHSIEEVLGFGTNRDEEQEFCPLYSLNDASDGDANLAYYTQRRQPRNLTETERLQGARSNYYGDEVFISIVDAKSPPYSPELRQLAVRAVCTNRDLPLLFRIDRFQLDTDLPVTDVRCVVAPTKPKPALADGKIAWRFVSHLSLNYLSLLDHDRERGAKSLRQLLRLYGDQAEPTVRKQVDGLRSISSRPVVRPLPTPGPRVFARGLQIEVTLDETQFEGSGAFLFGAVMDEFFAKYVSLNSFTETVVKTAARGKIKRWPARIGRRSIL